MSHIPVLILHNWHAQHRWFDF